ncbi:MAG TPA: suppressor of fused domain protein [Terrimicrobiaceae bacterium]
MSVTKLEHISLTKRRSKAYNKLFGSEPEKVFPYHAFDEDNDAYVIDVLVYSLDLEEFPGRVVAAVTNGMSDYIMTDPETGERARRELVQYFHDCDYEHAERLYDLAWMPLFDKFLLAEYQTIKMPDSVVPGSPLKNAFFLPPLLSAHREFSLEIEGISLCFLWHVPISDAELDYKMRNGANSLIERMQAVELPWIFDEAERPALL